MRSFPKNGRINACLGRPFPAELSEKKDISSEAPAGGWLSRLP